MEKRAVDRGDKLQWKLCLSRYCSGHLCLTVRNLIQVSNTALRI